MVLFFDICRIMENVVSDGCWAFIFRQRCSFTKRWFYGWL